MGLFKSQQEKELLARAKAGDGDAMMLLSDAYEKGDLSLGIKIDTEQSNYWFNRAVAAKNPRAMRIEGYWQMSEGAENNNPAMFKKGFAILEELYRMGYPEGARKIASVYNDKNTSAYDPEKYLYYLKLAADLGDADAQNRLGLEYLTGKLVQKSDDQSAFWYKKAMDNPSADDDAQYVAKNSYGCYLIRQGKIQEGIDYILEATKIPTQYPYSTYLWAAGQAYERLGQIDNAINAYECAATLPGDEAGLSKDRILLLRRS
ncbi:MAG: hypothetical protein WC183_09590 [Methanosarcina sp.]